MYECVLGCVSVFYHGNIGVCLDYHPQPRKLLFQVARPHVNESFCVRVYACTCVGESEFYASEYYVRKHVCILCLGEKIALQYVKR